MPFDPRKKVSPKESLLHPEPKDVFKGKKNHIYPTSYCVWLLDDFDRLDISSNMEFVLGKILSILA